MTEVPLLTLVLPVLLCGGPPPDSGLPAKRPESLAAAAEDAGYSRSLALVRKALERRPLDAELHFILGDVHMRQGRYREATGAFEKASRLDARDPKPILWEAECHARLGQHARAIETFRRLLVKEWAQVEVPARVGLAESLFQTAKHLEAAAEARAVVRRGEANAHASYVLGRALEAQVKARLGEGAGPEEIAPLEREEEAALLDAVRIDPAHAAARYILGTLYRRQGKLARAKEELEAFRRLKPLSSESNLGRIERAGEEIESRTFLSLARAALKAGDAREALALAEKGLARDPGFLELGCYRAWILLQVGRLDEAARACDAVLARDPANAEALWNLGSISVRQGQKERAAELVLRSLDVRKAFPDGWELLAILAQEHGVLPERLEEFARNALLYRPSAENHARLAMVLHDAGKVDECERVLREGLARHPGNPDLEIGLAMLLQTRSGKR
ncbi:MAG: tetratricopeptide repeat protein [Planctomycetes bacterium]|nr:tetratricopeptide repeat protein [Planctomycetota bacterium]